MRQVWYTYDDLPIVDWKGKLPVKGTPEWWEKQGYTVYRNKPNVFCFSVEVKDDPEWEN